MAKEWTPDEIRLFKANKHRSIEKLLAMFPERSRSSIWNMRFRINAGTRGDVVKKRGNNQYTRKPPRIPAHVTGSNELRDRTILAIVNYANDNGLGVDDAARKLLSEAC